MTRFLPTPRDRRLFTALHVHTRLTGRQVRRWFFHKNGDLVAPQTVHARLRKLVEAGYVDAFTLDAGHGAGPYAYGLTTRGAALLGLKVQPHRHPGPVWHQLEVADCHIVLEEALRRRGGRIVEWVGEAQLRALIRRKAWPVPDALFHWRTRNREGAVLLEWDRGSETLAVLTAKLERYVAYSRGRGHRELLPGLGLRPRLVIVAGRHRARRLVAFLRQHPVGTTVLVGVTENALHDPLHANWWRSEPDALGALDR